MSRSPEPASSSALPIPIGELLQHAGWLRGLAASLVRDPGRADDLVQETWLAALRRPPLGGAPARPWLERVFRNLARNGRRAERARDEHERAAPELRPSPGPGSGPGSGPASIAEEVEAQRLLAEAVGRLSDPARTIVVLRYFRGLDASAIGRELALPPGTVRWKLKLALEELRRELDRRCEGGRRAWSLVLARVLDADVRPALPLPLGWTLAATALVATVCVGGWGWFRSAPGVQEPAERVADAQRLEADAAALPDPGVRAADTVFGAALESTRRPLETHAPLRGPAKGGADITGSVLVDGSAPRGAIALEAILQGTKRRRLSTDETGRFAIFACGVESNVALSAPGYLLEDDASPVWGPWIGVTPCPDLVLELRTPPAIRGRVVTPDGEPVPAARGAYHLRATASDWSLDSGRKEFACEKDGRFELTLLGVMAGMPKFGPGDACEATLLFEMPRLGRGRVETGAFAPADMDRAGIELGDIVLEPVRVCPFVIRDERGLPLAGAVARLDDHWLARPSSPTNREGRGELRHVPERAVRVRFSALGYADRVLVLELGEAADVWLEPVGLLEVQLEPPANSYGPFPGLVLRAHEPLFVSSDAPRHELAIEIDAIQTELGASPSAGHGSQKDASGLRAFARFTPDSGGRALISGLRANVSFTLEACDPAGTVLVRREVVLTPGERKRISLPFVP